MHCLKSHSSDFLFFISSANPKPSLHELFFLVSALTALFLALALATSTRFSAISSDFNVSATRCSNTRSTTEAFLLLRRKKCFSLCFFFCDYVLQAPERRRRAGRFVLESLVYVCQYSACRFASIHQQSAKLHRNELQRSVVMTAERIVLSSSIASAHRIASQSAECNDLRLSPLKRTNCDFLKRARPGDLIAQQIFAKCHLIPLGNGN
jgi:hypothetical protein